MKILVTGSTGGIGKSVTRRLVELGHEVRATDMCAQAWQKDWEYLNGDVRDMGFVRRVVSGVEAVAHLAAIPFDMPGQEEAVLDTNLRGLYNVLLAAQEAGVRRVVNFSSINALGQAEPNHPGLYLPLDDDIPHYNVQSYSLSKHLGEEMCKGFAARGVYNVVSLRPTFVVMLKSERRWWDMLPEDFKIPGYVKDFFSYVDVRDVAEATALALEADLNGHQAFLLASPENRMGIPTAELVEKYYPHLPWPKIAKETYLGRDPHISLLDCSAARDILGWEAKYSIRNPEEGLDG
jgi:nucleoside-diphosphate-sugar epimerase